MYGNNPYTLMGTDRLLLAKHSAKRLTHLTSCILTTIFLCIRYYYLHLIEEELRVREAKQFVLGATASKLQSWDSNAGVSDTQLAFLLTIL